MRKAFVFVVLLEILFFAQFTWALDRQPNADYRVRRQALATKTSGGVVLFFAPTEAEGPNAIYGYRPDSNFFYLSGWAEPGAALLIAPAIAAKGKDTARAYTEILFLPAHNYAGEKWTGPKLGPENPEAARITGFDRVEVLDSMREELVRLLPQNNATIYTDVPAAGEISNSRTPLEWLSRANAFPLGVSYQDVRPLLAGLRTYKDAGEMDRIRKAVNASIAAHFAAMRTMKPGMNEREISALMQYEWGKRGCERPAYAPIVGSGFNSTVLHYSDDSGPIQSGDIVVIDAAGEYSLYASDITRSLPATGKFTARQREIYDIVLGSQRAAMVAFQSGKSRLRRDQPNSIYTVAYDYINTHGKDLHGEPLGKYFIHGLGHYVGLDVHDAGDHDAPLAPGMVFTIEPGIYIPEEKLGVRIEDMYYVDASGKLIELTEELPHTADEVERAMTAR
jgi:Xaa-Pro aminopeptidase